MNKNLMQLYPFISLENIFTICSYLLEGNLIQLRNYGTIDTNKICIEQFSPTVPLPHSLIIKLKFSMQFQRLKINLLGNLFISFIWLS